MERMPPDNELWGVLLYCERRASALRDPRLAREAALLCVHLWEYVTQQQDLHKIRAAHRALDAGATWIELAGPLRVSGPSGAYQKIRRLRAAELSALPEVGPVRRTPEAVARVEKELAESERKRRRSGFVVEEEGEEWTAQAQALLQVGESLPRDEAGIVAFWLEQMEYDLGEESPARAIAHDVQSLLRAVEIAGKRRDGTGAPDDEAGKVLASARAFVAGRSK
ncbi:hypothetical protein [Streptomyces sp. 5-10]|uniref:hypothetical protein n=1 Tax=Streptomyces sp. 5-10 TaxID=878925 RepID=UPI00168AE665|nr:hypothetical protein [Streptomyces sp. 5-10]MBD3004891.1 hypothetical protein [Streptomyces sp. 5-10]